MAFTGIDTGRVAVFYDGGCALCRREIDHYRRVDRAARVHWVDITREHHRLAAVGLDYESAMRRMYVLDEHGQLQSGARAFITLWRALPYYHRLAGLIEVLRLPAVLEWVYVRFARWRYARRCRQGACSLEKVDG